MIVLIRAEAKLPCVVYLFSTAVVEFFVGTAAAT